MNDPKNYKPVIGLEVHVELKTKSKMFCSCSADYFGKEPNTHTCPVCLGLPGALPVPNKTAIEWCIMIGLALNCTINEKSKFDRKNYFYPDLPKGYQISQYDEPFCVNGSIVIDEAQPLGLTHEAVISRSQETKHPHEISHFVRNNRVIRIRRVHMEEDTAKLMHQFGDQKSKIRNQNDEGYSLIDFNRSGVPLVEIVTEPDFESAAEVKEYLQKLQQIVRYLGVSNADMEKGDMRLEPNISLRKCNTTNTTNNPISNDQLPEYKVEVKNINSFKFVEKAINYELERQEKILEEGKTPVQETRGWDEKKQITVSQRVKEEANDYRYFPEPDIPPIRHLNDQISKIKNNMPELPDEKFKRFKEEYKLNDYDAEILTREKELAEYFEEAIRASHEISNITHSTGSGQEYQISNKTIANYIINKKVNIEEILPAKLIQNILGATQTVSIDEEELEKMIKLVLDENSKAVQDYKKGKIQVLGFLIGMVNRKLEGKKVQTDKIKNLLEKMLQ